MASSNTIYPCAICLETAGDPVVTRCGHLFCWPCLDQWLHSGSGHADCPVCKSRVSLESKGDVIPIYGTCTSSSSDGSATSNAPKTHAFDQKPKKRPTATNIPGVRRGHTVGIMTGPALSFFLFAGSSPWSFVFSVLLMVASMFCSRDMLTRSARWLQGLGRGARAGEEGNRHHSDGEGDRDPGRDQNTAHRCVRLNFIVAAILLVFSFIVL